jgi:dolichol-phosphate mannosyltransferase
MLLIVAALDEEEGIGPTLEEARRILDGPFCLVVDGGSRDNTVRVAELSGAKVIRQNGFGKGDAIRTGLGYACGFDFKYVALVDADYTYPAEYLLEMIEVLERNPKVGMVCGNRFGKESDLGSMANIFSFGNRLIAFTHNIFNGVNLTDPLSGLRVVRWEIIKNWRPESKGFDVEVELNHYVERKGFGILEVPIHYRKRLGEKKLKVRHGVTILKRIFLERIKQSVRANDNAARVLANF